MGLDLKRPDFQQLIVILSRHPDFSEESRRRIFLETIFYGLEREDDITSSLDLAGNPRSAAQKSILRLIKFGQAPRGTEVLSYLLEELISSQGENQESQFLQGLLARYPFYSDVTAASVAETDTSVLESEDVSAPFMAPVVNAQDIFVGRDDIVASLRAYMQEASSTLLLGMSGVGKTTIAKQIANQQREQFPDGVIWVNLSVDEETTIQTALGKIAQAFGQDLSHENDLNSRASRVQMLLSARRALVILDDVASKNVAKYFLPSADDSASSAQGSVLLLTSTNRSVSSLVTRTVELKPFTPEQYLRQTFELKK